MKIVFATSNAGKMNEAQFLLGEQYNIISLKDLNFFDDIPEPYDTFMENAIEKANIIYKKFKINCFAEDTGLIIDALGGKPGVKTARFAGENCTSDDNINKTLHLLQGVSNRTARFKTVVALIIAGNIHTFEGICEGSITTTRAGSSGFGYDPIFVPKGCQKTFAELSQQEKSTISHRAKAINKLIDFLKNTSL